MMTNIFVTHYCPHSPSFGQHTHFASAWARITPTVHETHFKINTSFLYVIRIKYKKTFDGTLSIHTYIIGNNTQISLAIVEKSVHKRTQEKSKKNMF